MRKNGKSRERNGGNSAELENGVIVFEENPSENEISEKGDSGGDKRLSGKSVKYERDVIMALLGGAGLMVPLIAYVRSHKRALLASGAKIANIDSLKPEQLAKELKKLPPDSFRLIEEWIAKNTRSAFSAFVLRSKLAIAASKLKPGEQTQAPLKPAKEQELKYDEEIAVHLLDTLAGLMPFLSGLIRAAKKEIGERCNIMLAAIYSGIDRYAKIAWRVSELNTSQSVGISRREQLRMLDVIFDYENTSQAGQSDSVMFLALACAIAIRTADLPAGGKYLESLRQFEKMSGEGADTPLSDRLARELAQMTPEYGIRARRTRQASDSQFSVPEKLDVLTEGIRVVDDQHLPFAFSKVLAVRERATEEWYEVTREQGARIFPNSGDLIHFSGSKFPELPRPRSFAVWRASEMPPNSGNEDEDNHRNKVMASRRVMRAQQIIALESVSSRQPDQVREWIIGNLATLEERDEASLLLHLSDGLVIHGPYSEMVQDGFTQQFRAWESLKMHQTASGLMLHIGELPPSNRLYDVVPPLRAAVRALRELQEFTSEEKGRFAEAIKRLNEHQGLAARLQDAGIKELVWSDEEMLRVQDLVLELPAVQERIERHVREKQDEAEARLSGKREEIRHLQGEYDKIIRLIEDKKKVVRGIREEVHAMVVKELEHARREGFKYATRKLFENGIDEGLKEIISQAERLGSPDAAGPERDNGREPEEEQPLHRIGSSLGK